MKDRNGVKIVVGDHVRIIKGMAVDGVREGIIESIDGYYVMVTVKVKEHSVVAERYDVEVEKI